MCGWSEGNAEQCKCNNCKVVRFDSCLLQKKSANENKNEKSLLKFPSETTQNQANFRNIYLLAKLLFNLFGSKNKKVTNNIIRNQI